MKTPCSTQEASWQCSCSCSSKVLLLILSFKFLHCPCRPVLLGLSSWKPQPACSALSTSLRGFENIFSLDPLLYPKQSRCLTLLPYSVFTGVQSFSLLPFGFPWFLSPLKGNVQNHTHICSRGITSMIAAQSLLCQICRAGDKLINS